MISERCDGCGIYVVFFALFMLSYVFYMLWYKGLRHVALIRRWAEDNSLTVISLRFAWDAAVENNGQNMVLTYHLVVTDGASVRSGLVGGGEFYLGVIRDRLVFQWD